MSTLISTPRTTMSPIRAEDWALFQRLHIEPSVIALCFDKPDERVLRDKFESRLASWTPECDHWLCLTILDANTQQPIGITGFVLEEGKAEVGYLLLPEFHGQQFGTETLEALLHWAETTHDLRRFSATVTEGNVASERVLTKCGFELSQVIPDAYQIGGKHYADKIYSRQK
ncbi:GNAT family N-acetyltransferase [Vibrio parahaemolyticus]|uniref:GNAT family N-acetyltransferase n=1 Tax=Vibrio parahaemolyticus TaxID=670 RepID=UPI00084BAA0C|nr:GNAT family N-acetyltransferase [Vibrio parahaemolyticus]ODY22210.1 GNAT family N-acetyltransferase [Vibrio parahaemolyticus]